MEINNNNNNWNFLPQEIVCNIFSYLERREKVAFSLACSNWENAVDTPIFWKRFSVKLDIDLNEPSVIYFLNKYYRYIKILKIGWSISYGRRIKQAKSNYKEILKYVGRFLVLLFERSVQVEQLTIYEWYDIYQLKKLGYLLMRFVKNQKNLESVALVNANLYDMNFSNILIAYLRSKNTLKKIEFHYTTMHSRKFFDSWVFTNCMEMMYNLEILTIDCWIFLQFFSKLQARIHQLRIINLYHDDFFKKVDTLLKIDPIQWENFKIFLPRAVVNLTIINPVEDDKFNKILQPHYDLITFKWNYTSHKVTYLIHCSRCLEQLVTFQSNSLEYIHLYVPYEFEELREKIQFIKRKCTKLKAFIFNGEDLCHPNNNNNNNTNNNVSALIRK